MSRHNNHFQHHYIGPQPCRKSSTGLYDYHSSFSAGVAYSLNDKKKRVVAPQTKGRFSETTQSINIDSRQFGKLLFTEEQRRTFMKGKPNMTLEDFSANVECSWKYLTQQQRDEYWRRAAYIAQTGCQAQKIMDNLKALSRHVPFIEESTIRQITDERWDRMTVERRAPWIEKSFADQRKYFVERKLYVEAMEEREKYFAELGYQY
ncbi:3171_t:CDS:2 [Paraglomus brasilianum]|uniref:3171_t:CDS:1 n=1 Tax=Paraglomus brasilianum TaxID=144538 RepID=A0A9N9ATS8_9GLOM|nr:3171_t:CDS:2 [Paraglomus brasilianum]